MNNLYYLVRYILKIKKRKIFENIFLMILASFSEMISLLMIIPFVSTLTNPDSINKLRISIFLNNFFNLNSFSKTVSVIAIVLCLTTILTNFLRAVSLRYSCKINSEITNKLSLDALDNFLRAPYLKQIEKNSGDLITKFNYFNKLFSGILMPIFYLLNYSLIIISIFLVLSVSSPYAALIVSLVITFFYLIIIKSTKSKIKNLSKLLGQYNLLHTRKLQEVIGGIKDINLKNNYLFYEKRYNEIDYKMRASTAEVIFLNGIPKFLLEGLGLSCIFAFMAIFSFKNEISSILPKISLILLAFQKMLPAIQNIYSASNTLRSNNYLLDAFKELLNTKYSIKKQKRVLNPSNTPFFQKNLIINSLTFSYKKNKKIINNFNFEIEKGDVVGVIGKTGCGKSTLIDLLLLLIKPEAGKLIVDGVDIFSKLKLQQRWQSIISHVPQEIFLDETTIKNNIAFGIKDKDIDKEQLIRAAKIAQIHNFIISLPLKYEALIGERGTNISGGQKQRLGIARCLYNKPEIIILDEATSALDNETEDKFINELTKDKKVTIIMVTHRLRSLEKCNKIINLAKDNAYQ